MNEYYNLEVHVHGVAMHAPWSIDYKLGNIFSYENADICNTYQK